MATVFANDQVAHVWAQRTQDAGRSHNGNYSFQGASLYSYSTCIARFVETIAGRTVALVTSRSYSQTTSGKHMPPIWRAITGTPYFRVPEVGAIIPGGDDHKRNLAHLVAVYAEAEKKFRGRGTVYVSSYEGHTGEADAIASRLRGLYASAADYAEAFACPLPATFPTCFADVDAVAKEIAEAREIRAAKAATPEAIAKREAEAEKRADRAERKATEARRVAHLAESEKRAEWLSGNTAVRFYGCDENGGAYMRVRGDNLETSQGATVPLAHAVRVFQFVKMCRDNGTDWHRNGKTIRVGHFQVDSIAASGDFVAGCHRFTWSEIERVAKAANLFDVAPSAAAVEPTNA